ncbi:MAG: NAD(P)-dependent oxidoreductase [Acidobacteria bacterium]|nr:NAD(P)-dependent oxidoreductase [Acidobacteriota bacterium]
MEKITRVGFIGLGNMGKPLAANLLQAGFDLMVYDVREGPVKDLAAKGAKVGASPAEIGRHGEVIELAVVDDAQVESVVLGKNGVLEGAEAGAVVIVHSTIHPRTIRNVVEKATAKKVGVLDAQMSGGARGVRARTLCFMVGGDQAVLEKCRPVLAASGKDIFHVGEVGMGAVAKAAQQAMICLNRLSAYEGTLLAERAGLDPRILQQIAHVTSAQSRIVDQWFEQYKELRGTDPQEAKRQLHLFYKGLCPALELAHDVGISLPGVALVQQLFDRVLGFKKPEERE